MNVKWHEKFTHKEKSIFTESAHQTKRIKKQQRERERERERERPQEKKIINI